MSRTKPPYPSEFREQIVELARVGRTPSELAPEFGIAPQTVTNWVAQATIGAGKPPTTKQGLSSIEHDELARLRRQVRQLQMERDILAKATAWFAAKGEKTFTPSSRS